jgi:pyruvate ferredoxin oxidoreductase beta subunit
VETGYWDLYEVETGMFRLTGASARTLKKGNRKPVKEYLRAQSRFRIMSAEQAADAQARVDAKWSAYSSREDR